MKNLRRPLSRKTVTFWRSSQTKLRCESLVNIESKLTSAAMKDLELVHLRIGNLAPIRLPRFGAHLKKLCLRQNFISRLEPEIFQPLVKLQELDLYDNKVKHVEDALNNLPDLSCVIP